MKFLSSASVAIIVLSVSSCSFKNDHPQKRQSFSERRDPKENSIASNGMLGGKKSHKVSVDYSDSNAVNQASSKVSQQPAPSVQTQAPAEHRSFFERLMNIGSDKTEKQSSANHVSYAYNNTEFTRRPTENNFEIARLQNGELSSQGSLQGSSYFDVAEPITSAPVHEVNESKLAALDISSSIINNAYAADEPAKLPALPQPITATENKPVPGLPVLDLPNAGISPVVQESKDIKPVPNVQVVGDAGVNNQSHDKQMPPVPAVPQGLDMDNKILPNQPTAVNTPQQPTMVHIPELPSNEQMKEKVSNQPLPQLNAVPTAPAQPQMPAPIVQRPQEPAHVVQPHVGHPTVPAPDPKNPEPVTHSRVEDKQTVETKSVDVANPVVKQKKKVKKPAKKAEPLKAEPDPVDFSSIQTMDNSVIVNDNGRYVAKKYLGATHNQ